MKKRRKYPVHGERPCRDTRNRLLGSLQQGDLDLLGSYFEPVTLKVRQRLEQANQTVKDVYFVEAGIVSVVAVGKGERRQAEVGIVGREGMTGLPVVLGVERSLNESFVQVEGAALRITAHHLQQAFIQSRRLHSALLHFAHVFFAQTAHTALANAQGKVVERLVRWLLMAQDRIDGDTLTLTHEFLALMLGVQRAGVTTALNELEAQGLVTVTRGRITVMDRDGLKARAKGLYGGPEEEFNRLFPARQRSDASQAR